MTKHRFISSMALLLAGACGSEAAPTTTPAPTRGYLPASIGHAAARDVARPRPATPHDPDAVGPDQPENVEVMR
jgi:hypothetical protein